MQLSFTQEELFNFLKSNPFDMPVFYEQNRFDKKYDAFLIFHRINDSPKYADDVIYFGNINFNFLLYTKTARKRDEICRWLQKKLNMAFDYSQDDFYYVANSKKEFFLHE